MSSILRPLGTNGPLIPRMGLGLMGLSFQVYGSIPTEEERFAFLDRAFEQGNRFWDTSDLYGDSEKHLGDWFKRTGKRDQIFLASKFGYVKGSKTHQIDSSYEYCKKACEASLKALGTDHIDLYYVHTVNHETPIEETMRGLAELQKEGKIKHIGVSMVSSETLRRASKIARIAAVQTEYSVLVRKIEGPKGTNLLATCRELGIAVVVATPLGRGLLTSPFIEGESIGGSGDFRAKSLPHFQGDNLVQNRSVAAQFKELADKKGCSMPQLALAWLLKQGDDIFPIPGTKKIKYLDDNWGALDVVLTDADNEELRLFYENAKVAGDSIPAGMESHVYGTTKEEDK